MELVTILILAIATFVSRLVNLLKIPIFTDEAIYIRWAQIGLNDPAHRYISLTDGKQPLFTWAMYPFLKIFSDPLFAGRFVSVVSSVGAVVGLYLLARLLFNNKIAFVSAVIYIASPFTLVYDRLALMDGLLASLGIWALYLEVLLVKKQKLDVALLLGLTIGANMLNKSSAVFYLYFLPISLLLFDFKHKKRIRNFLKWLGLSLISIILATTIYNSLRLSPWFYIIEQKNNVFIYTFKEFFASPLKVIWPNLNGLVSILVSYLTIPIGFMVLLGLLIAFFRKNIKIAYLFLIFIFPYLSLAFFAKIIFPRFILFMTVPLYIIAAYAIYHVVLKLKNRKIQAALFLIAIFIYPLFQSFLLVFSPVDASIHQIDRNQLFDDWPSGYGVRQVISYLDKKAESEKIMIGTEGTFGLNPAVYEIYLGSNPNVEIKGYWPVSKVPEDLLKSAKEKATFLVFKERQEIPKTWPLTLVEKYKRGKSDTYLYFFQVQESEVIVK